MPKVRLFRKWDTALLAAAFAAALGVYLLTRGGVSAAEVTVTVDGETAAVLPLSQDAEFEAAGVKVVVRDGEAFVEDADCPDKICVAHRPISRSGESIVCLPNRVAVTARSSEPPDVDAVS